MPIKILMPALSPTMTEGNLIKWHKQEGDSVTSGDMIAEIETDKATMEVEAIDEGTIGKILVSEGTEDVKVNTPIALLLEEGEDQSALESVDLGGDDAPSASARDDSSTEASSQATESPDAPAADAQGGAAPQGADTAAHTPASSHEGAVDTAGRTFASPVARRLATAEGVDVAGLQGTGPRGRVIKKDVEEAVANPAKAPKASTQSAASQKSSAPPQAQGDVVAADALYPAYTKEKLSNVRKVIAKRLTESKQQVPHFYLTMNCDITALLAARAKMNATFAPDNKVSINDIIIKAMATSLMQVPAANASYGDDHIKYYHNADISVAVATPTGLLTPVIRRAEQKTLAQISSEMKDLAQKARDNKLKPEEFQGGTISLSNLGMYGVQSFQAVINPPQGCILAVGAGEKKLTLDAQGQPQSIDVMSCTLSVDHRVVDGAVGAELLRCIKNTLENPLSIAY